MPSGLTRKCEAVFRDLITPMFPPATAKAPSPQPSPVPHPLADAGTLRCKHAKASLLGEGAGRTRRNRVPSPLAGEGQGEGGATRCAGCYTISMAGRKHRGNQVPG